MSEFNAIESSPYYDEAWFQGVEADADMVLSQDQSLRKLRLTSGRLLRNNLIPDGIQQAIVNMTVGTGIKVQHPVKRVQKVLNNLLQEVDKERFDSITDISEKLVNSCFDKGDVLINMVYTPYVKTKYKTSVELVEASRITTPPKHKRNPLVRCGVKYDNKKRILGYYVRKLVTNESKEKHYREQDGDYTFVPAYNKRGERSAWLMEAPKYKRPDQTRQVPMLTSSMNMLRYFNDYLETIIIQARVSSTFSAFIHTKNPEGTKRSLEEQSGSPLKNVARLKAGAIWAVNNGDKVDFASPNRPSDNTDQFIKRINRLLCMPHRIPYELLFMDLREVNYASYKAGAQEAKRAIGRWQRNLAKSLTRIIGFFFKEAQARMILSHTAKASAIRIIMPRFEVIDEEKFARANKINILQSGTASRKNIVDTSGGDYESVQEDLLQEELDILKRKVTVLKKMKEAAKEHGLEDWLFPENADSSDRETSKRTGEQEGSDVDEEDADERRKNDGNW